MNGVNPPTLLVACLCADWCGTCRDYGAVFEEAQQTVSGSTQWAWVDIEDHDDVLGALDIDNFPTLLIARGDTVLFYGTVLPHAQTLVRLVQNAQAGDFAAVTSAELQGLPARVRAVAGNGQHRR
jgi:thioredoxin-like negative regulator of GroEL